MAIVPHPCLARASDLPGHVADWLADLEHAGRSPHTRGPTPATWPGSPPTTAAGWPMSTPRRCAATSPGSPIWRRRRARKQAALASFLRWAFVHELIAADPMAKVTRVKPPDPAPRGLPPAQVARILRAIPRAQARDRLLFRLIHATGLRIAEALWGAHGEARVCDRWPEWRWDAPLPPPRAIAAIGRR